VLVPQHLLSLKAFEQAPAHKGAQDAPTQAGLGLGHHFEGDAAGRVKHDAGRRGAGALLTRLTRLTHHRLQLAIDCANMEMHMPVG
jgi:hypothetical protein